MVNRRLALCLPLVALTAAGCLGGGGSDADIPDELVCVTGDVPSHYLLQITGDFTASNLAELADHPSQRKEALREARFVGGHFSYWKQIVDDPPFDPPDNVLCEAFEFEDAAGAQRFLEEIEPVAGDNLPGLSWLPDEDRSVTELPTGDGTRAFRVSAGHGDTAVRFVATFAANGNFVQAVYVGGREASPRHEQEAVEIRERLTARTAPLTGRQCAAPPGAAPTPCPGPQ